MYDSLLINAPFWPEPLLEVDNTPIPKALVSALAGFSLNGFGDLGDEIQMIEGMGALGQESAQTCRQVGQVAGSIAAMGTAACALFTKSADRDRCSALVVAAGGGATSIIRGAMGCGGSRRVTVRPGQTGPSAAELENDRLRRQAEFDRRQAASSQRNVLLIGAGVATAAALAFIVLRR